MFSRVWTPPEKYTRTITRISCGITVELEPGLLDPPRFSTAISREMRSNVIPSPPLRRRATTRPEYSSNTLAKPHGQWNVHLHDRPNVYLDFVITYEIPPPSPLEWNSSEELLEWDATFFFSHIHLLLSIEIVARSIKRSFSARSLSRFVCFPEYCLDLDRF